MDKAILAIYINLVKMADAFANLTIDFIKFYVKLQQEKKQRNILLLQTNDTYKVVKRKLVVGECSSN